jgi:phosphotransferase system HPr (HPr) family protein
MPWRPAMGVATPESVQMAFWPAMTPPKFSRRIVVNNPQGLHARPADLLARLAQRFQSSIALVAGDARVDAKSILEILTLGAAHGTELVIEVEGPDADKALEAVSILASQVFSEAQG